MFIIFKIRKVHVYKNEIVFETGIYFEVLEDLKYPILRKKKFSKNLALNVNIRKSQNWTVSSLHQTKSSIWSYDQGLDQWEGSIWCQKQSKDPPLLTFSQLENKVQLMHNNTRNLELGVKLIIFLLLIFKNVTKYILI